MKPYEITASDVKTDFLSKLGQGAFGTVYKGTYAGHDVAIKVLTCKLTGAVEASFRKELDVMLNLHSPQVIRTFGGVFEGPTQAIVMEIMLTKGSLYDLLRNERQLPWQIKYRLALDIAHGIKYLHDHDILHRDLKSQNVLIDDSMRAKLCDFGLADVKTVSRSMASTKEADSKANVGTVLWMAPELFGIRAKSTLAADIYALGMVFFELLTHKFPFEENLQGKDPNAVIPLWLTQGGRPDLPADAPQEFKALIEHCWAQDMGARPRAVQVVRALEPLVAASARVEEVSPAADPMIAGPATAGSPAVPESGPQFGWGSGVDSSVLASGSSDARARAEEAEAQAREMRAKMDMMDMEVRMRKLAAEEARARAEPEAKNKAAAVAAKAASPSPAAGGAGLFAPALDQGLVDRFVTHVARGEQDEAKAMLDHNARLCLGRGRGVEHNGREFRDITGFQYALWALDWHMWEMILVYLMRVDESAAAVQCREQEALTRGQGKGAHYPFDDLLGALKRYIGQFDACYAANNWDALKRLWIHGVGRAQWQTVAHVAAEYCHPDRPFEPTPDFTTKPFPRQLKMDEGHWWTAKYNGARLGGRGGSGAHYGFGTCRAAGADLWAARWAALAPASWKWPGRRAVGGGCAVVQAALADRRSLIKLFETRTSQLKETQSRLLSHHPQPAFHP